MAYLREIGVVIAIAIGMAGICHAEPLGERLLADDLPTSSLLFNAPEIGLPSADGQAGLTSRVSWEEAYGVGPYCSSTVQDDHGLHFKLTEFNIYPTFSYLGSQSGTYNEFEFASHTTWGGWQMENRTVLNVADLPSTITLGPTNPGIPEDAAPPTTTSIRASGFGDILSGFFFSRETTSKTHFGVGPVFTFPSASDPGLGSEQYTVGPGAHFSTECGRLTAGFFLWQSWKFAGDDSQKRTNQLFGKPFFLYELSEKWNLVYVPLGLSHSWDAKSGEDWTVPLGGGLRRICQVGNQKIGFQTQVFNYVARKPTDPELEVRMTIEFLFDE